MGPHPTLQDVHPPSDCGPGVAPDLHQPGHGADKGVGSSQDAGHGAVASSHHPNVTLKTRVKQNTSKAEQK